MLNHAYEVTHSYERSRCERGIYALCDSIVYYTVHMKAEPLTRALCISLNVVSPNGLVK